MLYRQPFVILKQQKLRVTSRFSETKHRTTSLRGCAILDEICDNLDINKKNMSEKLFFMEQKLEKLKEDLTRYIDFSMDCIIVLGVEN